MLSKIAIQSFKSRDEQEVAGYAEAMDLVFEAFADLRLTENQLRQLHQTLLRHSDKDERHRGSYKTLANPVVAKDADGHEVGIVFETATPFDTPREIEGLIAWTRKALDDEAPHPLLIAAVFIVVFLSIHPFQDGNGRLSRVLTTLLLLRAGYGHVPYASLERVIEENKDLYYKALRRTQTTLKGDAPDWEPWIGFFCAASKSRKTALRCGWSASAPPKDKTTNYPTCRFRCSKRCRRRAPNHRATGAYYQRKPQLAVTCVTG